MSIVPWGIKPRAVFIGVVVSLLILGGCGAPVANRGNQGRTVICFGDSITEGTGVRTGEDYPSRLAGLLGQPVVNAGVRGDTTRDALRRLEKDVLTREPYLVIVEFGANDFFQKIPREETVRNLTEIVRRIQDRGATVVLTEVRMGVFRDFYYREFARIAKERQAVWIPDIMKGISFNARLKSDGIHPNAEGYALIAQRIYEKIHLLIEQNQTRES